MSDIEREAFEQALYKAGVEDLGNGSYEWDSDTIDVLRSVFASGIEAARQAPASGEVEPVAWECTEKHGATVDVAATRDVMETYRRMGRTVRPLVYADTHPPAKVPEDVRKRLAGWSQALTGWPKDTVVGRVKSQIDKLLTTPTPATTPEAEWVKDVIAERKRQDEKWGGPEHDDQKSPYDFVQHIEDYAGWARVMAGMGSLDKYRRRMIQVAALAGAAVEATDRALARPTPPQEQ